MPCQASQWLADDHVALDAVLKNFQEDLDNGDVAASHARLDLFWARLAVHIRAEHLHLFPAVINGLTRRSGEGIVGPTLNEGRLVVEQLRADHDFFMHELAQAVGILRDLVNVTDRRSVNEVTRPIRNRVLEIEKRLLIHNELEENQIYSWVKTILNEQEQADLATRINVELRNRPPRFSPDAWSNR
jgi:hypothetical protein